MTAQKGQKAIHGADMELEGLSWNQIGIFLRYSGCDLLLQVKQNADVYFDRFFTNGRKKRKYEERIGTVRCASISPICGSVSKP